MATNAPARGLRAGLQAAGRGFRSALASPEVKKTYLQLVAALFAIAAVINVVGLWAVLHYTPIDGDESAWVIFGIWMLRIAAGMLVLFVAPILALFVANILFPLLGERVFLAGVRAVDPRRADELASLEGLPLRVTLPQNVIRLLVFVGLTALVFAASFIPVVGPILAPVAQAYITARSLGWELLDPYFEKLQLRLPAQHAFVKQHRGSLVGFALPFSLSMSVPLVGPLLFGLAQASAGTLVTTILEHDGQGGTAGG